MKRTNPGELQGQLCRAVNGKSLTTAHIVNGKIVKVNGKK